MGLAKRIIPCLDIDCGRIVKGTNFVDIIDAGDPVETAKQYNKAGAAEICFLDITATIEKRKTIIPIVEKVAAEVFIPLTVGGGVRELKDIRNLLNAGADKVAVNTTAVFNPDFIREATTFFGSQCIVVAIDAKRVNSDNKNPKWEIFTHGGRKETGLDALDWAVKMAEYGAGELLITSMDRDGTKNGFDNELMSRISKLVDIPIIASGGVGNLEHLVEGVTKGLADAVLAASIFHFGEYSIKQAKEFMQKNEIEVRI